MYPYYGYRIGVKSEINIPLLTNICDHAINSATLKVNFLDSISHSVGRRINESLYIDSQNYITLNIPNICTYKITDEQILVSPYESTDTLTILNYLVSMAIPYFLAKRGIVILRGCSFTEDGESASLLLGVSSVGKSTFTASFAQKNHKILSDQYCILSIENNAVFVTPAFSNIKLLLQATRKLKINIEEFLKVQPGLNRFYWESPFCNKKFAIKNISKIKEQNLESDDLFETIKGINKIKLLQDSGFGSNLFREE